MIAVPTVETAASSLTIDPPMAVSRLARLRWNCGWLLALLVCVAGCHTYHNLPETIANNTDAIDAIMRQVDTGVQCHVIEPILA